MSDTPAPSTPNPRTVPTEDEFKLWAKYEEIAMHFNDLLMRWRLQAIGGMVTLVMVAGTVVKDVEDPQKRYSAMLLLSGTLLCAWVGLAVMDIGYYRRLLTGAVKELLRLEASLPVQLSTVIEEQAECGAKWTPWLFYILGGVPLVAFIWYALCQLNGSSVSEAIPR